ncbi:MAG: transposase [Janthinobacterium lividum]
MTSAAHEQKLILGGLPTARRKYTSGAKAACVCQVAAGARQPDATRVHGTSPALFGRWQRQVLEQTAPSSAERDKMKRQRAELKWSVVG